MSRLGCPNKYASIMRVPEEYHKPNHYKNSFLGRKKNNWPTFRLLETKFGRRGRWLGSVLLNILMVLHPLVTGLQLVAVLWSLFWFIWQIFSRQNQLNFPIRWTSSDQSNGKGSRTIFQSYVVLIMMWSNKITSTIRSSKATENDGKNGGVYNFAPN